jgi:5-methylcytosine-specific restriction protein A
MGSAGRPGRAETLSRAPKICGHHPCVQLVRGTRYCPQHQREHAWQGSGGDKRSGTTEHKKRRLRVLKRDGYRCHWQYPGICQGTATELDHVVALSEGGPDLDSACVGSCRACHLRRSSRQGHRASGHSVADDRNDPDDRNDRNEPQVALPSPALPRVILPSSGGDGCAEAVAPETRLCKEEPSW